MTDNEKIAFKKKLRAGMKKKLQAIPQEERLRLGNIINTRLFYTPQFKMAKIIATTISFDWEVHTDHTILAAWAAEKTVVVPRVTKGTRQMDFYAISDINQLEKTHFGLWEPKLDLCPKISINRIDLAVIPGLLFDRDKNRLGYGGGYYDTFLAQYTGDKFALAYDIQLVDKKLPTEPHDQKIDKILTESEIF